MVDRYLTVIGNMSGENIVWSLWKYELYTVRNKI